MASVHTLPPIVYELIIQRMPAEDLPIVRLVCTVFAEAAAVTSRIRAIHIETWTHQHTTRVAHRLSDVQHMHAEVGTPADWNRMQQLAQQLPKLRSLHCSGRRSWYRMNNGNSATTAAAAAGGSVGALPSLQAAIFEGTVQGLEDIAALAPNLRQLYCSKLRLPKQSEQQVVAAPHPSLQLLQLTHFGSESVHVGAEDEAEAAAAFATAFPALQVLFRTPEFGSNLTYIGHIQTSKVPLRDVIAKCTALHTLRVFGSTTDMCGLIAQQLAGLQHIKRLCVYGIGPAVELKGFRQLTQLQQLQLTFEVPAKRAALKLLQDLNQLQQLRMLALPAKLLCGQCCPGMRQAVEGLAKQCSSCGCKLVLLKRQKRAGPQAAQAGDYCQHAHLIYVSFTSLLLASAPAAAAACADAQKRDICAAGGEAATADGLPVQQVLLREMQQQEEPQLPEHVLRERGYDGVWGLLGACEAWWE